MATAAAPADESHVTCGFCPEDTEPVCFCLQCVAFICERHLQDHLSVAAYRPHRLVAAAADRHGNLCSDHGRAKELLCRVDRQLLCLACSFTDQHRDHQTVPSAPSVQERAEQARRLQQEGRDISDTAQEAEQHVREVFSHMGRLLEERHAEVQQQIQTERQTRLSQVRELQEQLQGFPSLSAASEPVGVPSGRRRYFDDVAAAVRSLGDAVRTGLEQGMGLVSQARADTLLSPAELRQDFVQHSQQVTLDVETASVLVVLSRGDTRAQYTDRYQGYPELQRRFPGQTHQVLSAEPLEERSYWEAEFRGEAEYFRIAVAYRDVSQNGAVRDCIFGHNDRSWALLRNKDCYVYCFNGVESELPGPVGAAGVLSFYSVESEYMRPIHRVQTQFDQPLYAGVMFYSFGDYADFIKPE